MAPNSVELHQLEFLAVGSKAMKTKEVMDRVTLNVLWKSKLLQG